MVSAQPLSVWRAKLSTLLVRVDWRASVRPFILNETFGEPNPADPRHQSSNSQQHALVHGQLMQLAFASELSMVIVLWQWNCFRNFFPFCMWCRFVSVGFFYFILLMNALRRLVRNRLLHGPFQTSCGCFQCPNWVISWDDALLKWRWKDALVLCESQAHHLSPVSVLILQNRPRHFVLGDHEDWIHPLFIHSCLGVLVVSDVCGLSNCDRKPDFLRSPRE